MMGSTTGKSNTELTADDTEQLRGFIDRKNKEGLVNFLVNHGGSVNSVLNLRTGGKTFPLHLAVNVTLDNYEPEILEYLLSKGSDTNVMDSGGYSPLHHAVIRDNIAAAEALLDAGADINLQVEPPFPSFKGAFCGFARGQMVRRWRKKKSYPLHLAVSANNDAGFITAQRHAGHAPRQRFKDDESSEKHKYDMIRVLLSRGADCNLLDGNELAPLHYAVSQNDESLVAILLDAGAIINIQSHREGDPFGGKGPTPLFHVSQVSMLKFLLSRNADPEATAWDDNTVLHCFIYNGLTNLTKYLVSDVDLSFEMKNSRYQSALAVALKKKDDKTVHLLMSAGCDPGPEVFKVNERISWIYTQEGEEMMNVMKDIASNPRQLVELCTFRIRRILKRNITTAADRLPLPVKLRERLTFGHLN